MTHKGRIREVDVDDPTGRKQTPRDEAHEGDLRLTVRRLELPVRPRGVLAE